MSIKLRLGQIIRWLFAHIPLSGIILSLISYIAESTQVVRDRQQMSGMRLLVQLWLRYALVRVIVAFITAFVGVLIVVIFFAYHEITPADMYPVNGHFESSYKSKEYYGRMVILLKEYRSPFLLPAHSEPFFDEQRFVREVHNGDKLFISINRDELAALGTGELLVAHEIRSESATYLTLAPVAEARRREAMTFPALATAAVVITAVSMLTVVPVNRWWARRRGYLSNI